MGAHPSKKEGPKTDGSTIASEVPKNVSHPLLKPFHDIHDATSRSVKFELPKSLVKTDDDQIASARSVFLSCCCSLLFTEKNRGKIRPPNQNYYCFSFVYF